MVAVLLMAAVLLMVLGGWRGAVDDQVTRKRAQQKARRKRWRRRQRKGVRIVDVPISDRVLTFLLETGRISDAECAADDRSADGAIARTIARLAEQLTTDWEQRTGRISTG
jgi:hypothetical protein